VDQFGPSEADAEAAIDPALTYDVRYDVIAAYAQISFDGPVGWADLRGNAGVRFIRTEYTGSGF